ncbi:ATP-binding protein [Vibrio sp. JPW-9-11-11]|uniref:ATP-binding protein n=1 Tax=Vibrio sp. JPW-9-11-11 TaxID=1416532 RepID=UPI001594711F|nr:ATP-binding protein [Vibrio sp. JPW-9-11-11]NVD06582.1 ATP-binding protein [Vibrio sp. JPW-9-11-11]
MRVKLTIIRGLPGSGKSTLAKSMPAVHLEADMFFVNQAGEYHFEPTKLALAHQWCQDQTRRCLELGSDVVVSNTFVRRWEITPYYQLAKQYQAHFEVIECHDDFGSIHGVDRDKIEIMKRRWQTWRHIPDPRDKS